MRPKLPWPLGGEMFGGCFRGGGAVLRGLGKLRTVTAFRRWADRRARERKTRHGKRGSPGLGADHLCLERSTVLKGTGLFRPLAA
jgi:hypothetical protein